MTRVRSEHAFQKLGNLIGISLNVVLDNGKTYFGTLVAVSQEMITIQDSRQHPHKLLIPLVYEVVYDYENLS